MELSSPTLANAKSLSSKEQTVVGVRIQLDQFAELMDLIIKMNVSANAKAIVKNILREAVLDNQVVHNAKEEFIRCVDKTAEVTIICVT